MTDSEHDDDGSHEEEVNENMKVFCRLRPMNKLEMSRRSKNCVDLPDDDPRCLTVDSPLEGEYDFFFDHVFEEYASQEEVYESSIAPVPGKLLEGYNCTVLAYGQTGSGKTHTMMGINGGADGLLALTQPPDEEVSPEVNPEAQGMILRTAHYVFQQIQEAPTSMEYTIRCSYVEIYLEKILDLLNPGGSEKLSIVEDVAGDEAAGVGDASCDGGVRIAGAAELCCFDEADVYGLLARGNACRTMSRTEMNTDSSRSHAIFVMKVEQHDKKTGMVATSKLHMIDLAGSEMASSQSATAAQRDASAVQMEAKMINKSLTALQNCIRAQLENQQGADHKVAAMSKVSKLTRFLRPSFGGNCMTWLILTASPSSYNIGETISTIKFGQRVGRIQNPAVVNADYSRAVYRKRLKESEKQRKGQMAVLRAVALECKKLKTEAVEGSFDDAEHDGPLWDTIEELLASEDDADEVVFSALRQGNAHVSDNEKTGSDGEAGDELDEARREIEKLREQLESITKARDDSDNQLTELQSEVAVLRSQNEHLIDDKTKDLEELINAKNELQIMSQRKIEVEHNFRTSQFRENEAIVFLRTFRRFYKNVLRDRAAHGSGSIKAITKEVSDKVPGALDLSELVDADALLLESGLIEEHEMRDDKSAPVYVPSKTALIRSTTAAKKAAKEMGELEKKLDSEATETSAALKREDSGQTAPAAPGRSSFNRRGSAIRRSSFTSLEKLNTEEEAAKTEDALEPIEEQSEDDAQKQPGAGADAGAGSSQPAGDPISGSAAAALLWDQSGTAITNRQKFLGTPAGRFAIMQEKNVEKELEDMADRCVKLEQALKEERATVDMLSGRAGGANKKKLAQEAIQLRQQVEKKTQNLMAIAWKMNELNLVNRSYNEKMVNREQHVIYLEENYVELQNRNRMIIEEQQEAERKLRDELDSVRKVLGGMSVSLWQYKEENLTEERSLGSRLLVPVHGGSRLSQIDGEPLQRRLSDAESEPSLDFHQEVEKVDSSTQTDEVELEDAQVQTEEEVVDKEEIGIQTDEVLQEDIGTMTEESLGTATLANRSSDLVDASVQTDDQEAGEKASTGGKLAAAGVMGAAVGAAAAVVSSSQTERAQSNEPESDEKPDNTAGKLATAGAVEVPITAASYSQSFDDESDESYSEGETDFAGKINMGVTAAATSSQTDDEQSEASDESDSDNQAAEAGEKQVIAGVKSDTEGERAYGDADDNQSDDDIEALTGELAATGVVPENISIDSDAADDEEESIETEVVDKPPGASGKAAAAGISSAAVVAAAASITREAETEKSKDSVRAKNIFAATVMSVLNRGTADKKEETEKSAVEDENEIESYHGDGHSPKHAGHTEDAYASSRDEWAAARDDFDSIFEETATAVKTSSAKRQSFQEEDTEKFKNKEFIDIAAKIGHQNEDQIVTMGSQRQFRSKEVPTAEEPRKPWEKGQSGDDQKPWKKSPKKGKDEGSLGSSFDIAEENWYGGSDDESDGSYQFETHVLKRPQKEEPPRKALSVKFSDSTVKRDTSTSEDEFDKMMSATQAALGAAEKAVADHEEDVPEKPLVSLASKEEAMFTGGRPNDFQPRRSVEKPKIRAGVLKEEKKPSRDKSKRQLLRKKSESRRRLGDEKKRKKTDDRSSRKKSGSRSPRNISRAKSERYPQDKRDKDPRRKSAGRRGD